MVKGLYTHTAVLPPEIEKRVNVIEAILNGALAKNFTPPKTRKPSEIEKVEQQIQTAARCGDIEEKRELQDYLEELLRQQARS